MYETMRRIAVNSVITVVFYYLLYSCHRKISVNIIPNQCTMAMEDAVS